MPRYVLPGRLSVRAATWPPTESAQLFHVPLVYLVDAFATACSCGNPSEQASAPEVATTVGVINSVTWMLDLRSSHYHV